MWVRLGCLFFIFFFRKASLIFLGDEGKGGLASVSDFVLQTMQISKKNFSVFSFFFFFFLRGGGLRGGGAE